MSDTELILQHHKLKRLIQIAVGEALQQQGKVKNYMSQSQAYLKYGESNVKMWVRRGQLRPVKGDAKNSIVKYLITDLELCAL